MQPPTQPVPNKVSLATIDAVEDEYGGRVTVAPNDGRVTLRGWALDAGARAFAEIEAAVGGARAASACTIVRPDVAALFGSPDEVGFRIELPLDGARVGHHVVELRGRRADGSQVAIAVPVAFDVVEPLRSFPRGVAAGALVGFVDEVRAESPPSGAPAADPVVIPADGAVIVRGWAATPAGAPASAVYAELDGQRLLRGMSGYPRPDAAAQFGAARSDYGFRIRITGHELGRGEHTVRVHAVAGGAVAAVGGTARVSVGPPSSARVFESDARVRGRIDVVARLEGDEAIAEERAPLQLRAGERAVVTGWAGDPAGSLPGRIVLAVDGVAHGPVQRGLERPDVVQAYASEALRASGFCAIVRADALGVGFHRAEVIAVYDVEPVVLDAFSFEVIA